jgi:hypothetical protein
MRQVAQSRELRERLGARGLLTVQRELSPAALAPLVTTRLHTVHALLRNANAQGGAEPD